MGVQKKSSDIDIKQWESPKIIVLDISDTKSGSQEGQDAEGFDEQILPPIS